MHREVADGVIRLAISIVVGLHGLIAWRAPLRRESTSRETVDATPHAVHGGI